MHSQAHSGMPGLFAARGIEVTPFTNQITWLFDKPLEHRPSDARLVASVRRRAELKTKRSPLTP